MLAGLQELMPWLHTHWHNEPTDLGESYADAYDAPCYRPIYVGTDR